MSFWSNFGTAIRNFASKTADKIPLGVPIAKKTTPEFVRVSKAELEQTYIANPIVFNFVNKIVHVILSPGYELVGETKAVEEVQHFLDSIGEIGGETSWESLLEQIFRDQCIYGEAWVEKICTEDGLIVDLDIIDAKKMDYLKDHNDYVLLDEYQNPVGYVETLPFGQIPEDIPRIPIPEKYADRAKLTQEQIYFPPDRIAHFKLFTVGDGLYPIGLVEPCYKASLRKLNMEEALANALYRLGFPLLIATIGDQDHNPAPEAIQNALKDIKNIKYNESIAVPYWVKVGILESKHPEKLREHLEYFTQQEIAASGMPSAFVTGKGEETNRATLNRQEYLAKISLKHIIRNTCRVIEREIFKPFCEQRKLKSVPKIKWHEIVLEELDSKAERLLKYAKGGYIVPDRHIEEVIRREENLPPKHGDED